MTPAALTAAMSGNLEDLMGYPGETNPSCGSMACELRMQAAADYHADRGG